MRRKHQAREPLSGKLQAGGYPLSHQEALDLLLSVELTLLVFLRDGGCFRASVPEYGTVVEYNQTYFVSIPQEVKGDWILQLQAVEVFTPSPLLRGDLTNRLELGDIAYMLVEQVRTGNLVFEAQPQGDEFLLVCYSHLMRMVEAAGSVTLADGRTAEWDEGTEGPNILNMMMTFDNRSFSFSEAMAMGWDPTLPVHAIVVSPEHGVQFYAVEYAPQAVPA